MFTIFAFNNITSLTGLVVSLPCNFYKYKVPTGLETLMI